jgi:hypothetical protein
LFKKVNSSQPTTGLDLQKIYGKYGSFYLDHNIDGLIHELHHKNLDTTLTIIIRHKDLSNEMTNTTLVIETIEGSGALLYGDTKIVKFLEENSFEKISNTNFRELDALLTKYEFDQYNK